MGRKQVDDLPMPIFAKVKYHSWLLDDMTPALEFTDHRYFHKKELGIEVSGQSTTYSKLTDELLKQGVILMSMSGAKQQHQQLLEMLIGSVIPNNSDRLTAQNMNAYNTGIFLYIPDDTRINQVLHLTLNHLSVTGNDFIARIFVYVGQNVTVDIMQTIRSNDLAKSKASVVIEVFVAKGSKVNYVNVDAFSQKTTSYINKQAAVGDYATIDWSNVSFNDGNVITQLESRLNGEGATSHVDVIALTNEKQTQGLVTEVRHTGRHSVGHIFQRGVILNHSALIFNCIGRIIKGAKGSDSQQESRVLMLSHHARGEANPLLLIDENDVTAGHAASVGRIDEQQMYYLMSRGLTEKVARKLVIRGFMGAILAKMPTKKAQQDVIDELERKLLHEGN